MNTFLFSWNPKKWHWENIEKSIEDLEKTGRVSDTWPCMSFKKVRPGDRAFLIRLGKEPRGIVASGFVATPSFLAPHWNDENILEYKIIIDFEVLLNAEGKDPILPLDSLQKLSKEVHWTPEKSGILIKPQIADKLETMWFNFLNTNKIRNNPFIPTDNESQRTYAEGTPNQVILTKYERNPYARKECIKHYGYSCFFCGFNFERKYGPEGKDFIHVHHLNQVAKIGKTYEINPITDLRPVCPNCHSIIHRKKKALTIEEMKNILR